MASLVGKLLRHGRRLASRGIKFEVKSGIDVPQLKTLP
jgi:hypothetical protein